MRYFLLILCFTFFLIFIFSYSHIAFNKYFNFFFWISKLFWINQITNDNSLTGFTEILISLGFFLGIRLKNLTEYLLKFQWNVLRKKELVRYCENRMPRSIIRTKFNPSMWVFYGKVRLFLFSRYILPFFAVLSSSAVALLLVYAISIAAIFSRFVEIWTRCEINVLFLTVLCFRRTSINCQLKSFFINYFYIIFILLKLYFFLDFFFICSYRILTLFLSFCFWP